MVSVQNIRQHNQSQTGINFGFDETLKQKARQISARWNQTYKCWYVNHNTQSFQKITITFPDIEILYVAATKPETPAPGLRSGHDIAPKVAHTQSNALQSLMLVKHKAASNRMDEIKAEYISIAGKYWVVKIPYNQPHTKAMFCGYQRFLREQNIMIKTSKSYKFLQLLTS